MEHGTVNELLGGLDPNGLKYPTAADAASAKATTQPTRNGEELRSALGLGDLRKRLEIDRLKADLAEEQAQPPRLTPPPKQQPITDPFQAFGQPAMFIAALGSLFTRRPFVNAIQAAGAVLQSTQQLDAARAKQAFDTWKIETENGLKLANYQEKRYADALKRIDVNSKSGKAAIETEMIAMKDHVALNEWELHGEEGLKDLLFARKKQADSVEAGIPGLTGQLQEGIDIATLKSSENRNDVAEGIVMEAGKAGHDHRVAKG